jgi:hypothetical protein
VAALLAAAVLGGACRRAEAPVVTYFDGPNAVSLRYPATWTAQLAEQGGMRYRYFQAPGAGAQHKAVVTVTLLAQTLAGSLDEYAQGVLAGLPAPETRDESRGAAHGRRYRATSPDGATRHSLLLVQEDHRAFGLHAQGDAAAFGELLAPITAMEDSFTLERVAAYPERRNDEFGYALRVPASWKSTRTLAGRGSHVTQYLSPPLAVEPNGQTVHASLTLTVEPAPGDGTAAAFRQASREKLGDALKVIGHDAWRDGLQDVLLTETPLAVSRGKRFYRTAGGRAYGLAFEAREDVFPRVSRWCDLIASTLRIGPELGS